MADLPGGAIRSADDSRGRLVAVEHGLLPFRPERTFVVSTSDAPVGRGGHVAGCRQLLVLVSGRAAVLLEGPGTGRRRVELAEPGAAVLVAADDYVDYWLEQPGSVVLVLAEQPFRDRGDADDAEQP